MKKLLPYLAGAAFALCLTAKTQAQTSGTLTFTFTTPKHTTGNYTSDGRYCLAVWIESCATCGSGTTVGTSTYVRTKMRYWGGNTSDHLPTWVSKSGSSTTNATTGATLTTFVAKTITWDGKNAAQTALLADGNYRVCIQETWGHGTATVTRYLPFTKGMMTDSQTPTADGNFTAITLKWIPASGVGVVEVAPTPQLNVYPNPSNGLIDVDFYNVNNLKVINTIGAVVFEEKVDPSILHTSVDLSNLANGIYFISVSNENGTSNKKIILNK